MSPYRETPQLSTVLPVEQGRGLHTHAFTHAMERDHHVFMKLEDGTVWCLPDGYRVEDRSLEVIRFVLNPKYEQKQVRSQSLA